MLCFLLGLVVTAALVLENNLQSLKISSTLINNFNLKKIWEYYIKVLVTDVLEQSPVSFEFHRSG